MSTYGEMQRQLRKRAGLYLGDLAEKIGCTAAYISDVELGRKKPPKPSVVTDIALALGANPDEMVRLRMSAELARSKWTFEAHGRREEETEFITALARMWDDGISNHKLQRMRAILMEEDREGN